MQKNICINSVNSTHGWIWSFVSAHNNYTKTAGSSAARLWVEYHHCGVLSWDNEKKKVKQILASF